MSADNGIYILQCKDQFRVIHASAIENLWWSQNGKSDELVPKRLVEYFGNCKYTRSSNLAMKIAHKMLREIWVCEYGIHVIPCEMTWEEVKSRASG